MALPTWAWCDCASLYPRVLPLALGRIKNAMAEVPRSGSVGGFPDGASVNDPIALVSQGSRLGGIRPPCDAGRG